MTTQAEVVLNIRSRLDEPAEMQFKDSELIRWANEGARDISRRTETLQTTVSIPAVAAQQQYSMPADLVRCYRVEYVNPSSRIYALEYRDFNNMDSVWYNQSTTSATPLIFTLWGFPPTLKMIVYPLPDSSAGSFNVYYYRLSADLPINGTTPTATLDLPAGFEELVIDYAEYMALRKDRDPRWQEAYNLYEKKVEAMYEQTRRWSDQAGTLDVGSGLPLHPFIWNEDW